ncbi:type II toxin-antitoxin system RelE/ParE family toxin [Pseudoalteromonas rubra]|uniref:Toxin n=1 Tax=Pseudoalteromonas rubra TaxID=43658 RepID=A0A0U2Y7P6_9GAMM|nr:type II toxin-antitoxin system RelE/ParE family toxin [Pseudoalteromonas rubra]ALU46130.1 hypothetical protein AT705_24520 [Pseudoalteromonas rubra]
MVANTLVLKPRAEQDLERIFEYSYTEFGWQQAQQYISDLDQTFQTLAASTDLAINYDHVRPGLKAFPVGAHIVFFRATDTGIEVIRVLHQSMDYPRHV